MSQETIAKKAAQPTSERRRRDTIVKDPLAEPVNTGVSKLLDRFEVQHTFGRGRNGTVFQALDTASGMVVALKQVPKNTPQEKIARREYDITQKLNHAGIIKYTGILEDESSIYLVREWVDGKTLREAGRLGPQDREKIITQVLDVLSYIHGQEVVLRDLKSSNVVLTPQGKVKIIDLGGSIRHGTRDTGEELSTFGAVGTFVSTAPEVWLGAADYRSDIYSTGSLFAELCLDHAPEYDMARDQLKFTAISHEEHRKLIEKAMAKEPNARFATANDFLKALKGNNLEENAGAGTHAKAKVQASSMKKHVVSLMRHLWPRTIFGWAIVGSLVLLYGIIRNPIRPVLEQPTQKEQNEPKPRRQPTREEVQSANELLLSGTITNIDALEKLAEVADDETLVDFLLSDKLKEILFYTNRDEQHTKKSGFIIKMAESINDPEAAASVLLGRNRYYYDGKVFSSLYRNPEYMIERGSKVFGSLEMDVPKSSVYTAPWSDTMPYLEEKMAEKITGSAKAKELLLGGGFTSGNAAIILAKKIDNPTDAKEVLGKMDFIPDEAKGGVQVILVKKTIGE